MSNAPPPLTTRLLAEGIGSAFLVVAVIGSGIMAETLSPTDVGLQLLENSAATAGALIGLIIMFATVSGAHFNPAVTLVERLLGRMNNIEAASYVGGGGGGQVVAEALPEELCAADGAREATGSQKDRNSAAELLSEVIAMIGLLLVIHGAARLGKPHVVAVAVGVWIGGAYFFTSSTSFANPMVSVARTLSDTFAGIAPSSAPGFIAAQLVGALIARAIIPTLFPVEPAT